MPAPQRSQEVELETMVSWDTSNPTLGADLEGWLNYHTSDNRWYYWDGTNWIKLALDSNNAVTDANLRDSAALSVIGRSANSTGDPADIAASAASGAVLRESGSTVGFGQVATAGITDLAVTDAKIADDSVGSLKLKTDAVSTIKIQDDAVTLAKEAHASTGGPSVRVYDKDGVPEVKQVANVPAYLIAKNLTSSTSWPAISGTTFPASPVDGQKFTHTTHRCSYFYDSAAAGWLSEAVFVFDIGTPVDTAATAFIGTGPALTGDVQFSSTKGYVLNFAAKVVGLCLSCDASTTGDIQVFDDGSAVSGATLSLSAVVTKADDVLMSTTIAANSVIGAKVTSGTVQGPAFGQIRLRRFET